MFSITLKRFNQILLCCILVCGILYFAKKVLIPITFAVFFAMLFAPMCNFLEKHGFKRAITALLAVIITMGLGMGIVFMVYSQGKDMVKQLPQMEQKSQQMMEKAQTYVTQKFNVPKEKQDSIIAKQVKTFSESSGSFVKKSFMDLADFFAALVLVILFLFLFLFQKEKYEAFFLKLSKDAPTEETKIMLENISKVSAFYVWGRILSIVIFTICFTVGFMIVGLENAFLLAFIAAILTIIPYVGSIIGGLIPFAVALVTGDSGTAIGALTVVLIVQGIDNYFVEPYIIGGQVSISAFFTILILFVGGILWGVAGMILFIPMLGVFKVICDHVPELNPYGFLIGDQKEITGTNRLVKWFREKFHRNTIISLNHKAHKER